MTYPDLDLIHLDTDWLCERRGFITGATGWIGSWICQALDHIGARYLPLKHTERQNIDNFRIPACKIDYIIHLAPGSVYLVIECAQEHNVDAVLFTSSGAVYADELNDYAKMKLLYEQHLLDSGLPVKIARCFTFAGAGIPLYEGFALGCFIAAALNNEPIRIWSDGAAIRTYMYMTDLITWLFRVLIWGKVGFPYNVGAEEEITIWELARIIKQRFDGKPDIIIENQSKYVERFPYYVPDTTMTELLGCRVEVPLEEAIDKTVNWYKEQYAYTLSDM